MAFEAPRDDALSLPIVNMSEQRVDHDQHGLDLTGLSSVYSCRLRGFNLDDLVIFSRDLLS